MIDEMIEHEKHQIKAIKEGLEDLNLFFMEIEHTYNELGREDITDSDKQHYTYRLKTLETYIANMNDIVKNSVTIEINKDMLS